MARRTISTFSCDIAYSSRPTKVRARGLRHRPAVSPQTSAARVLGFRHPPRLTALLYDQVIALSVHDPLRLWLLVTGVHHEPAGVGADTLVLAQCGLDDVVAVWASALTQERC